MYMTSCCTYRSRITGLALQVSHHQHNLFPLKTARGAINGLTVLAYMQASTRQLRLPPAHLGLSRPDPTSALLIRVGPHPRLLPTKLPKSMSQEPPPTNPPHRLALHPAHPPPPSPKKSRFHPIIKPPSPHPRLNRPGFSPNADSHPATPAASSPAPPSPTAGGTTLAVTQAPTGVPPTPEVPVGLTGRLLLDNDTCGTMSFSAAAGMTVLSVWAGVASLWGLPQGCVSHALCNGQLAQAEQTLAALGSGQTVQLDFVLLLQGPHLVQLTLRDSAQTALPASFLQCEMLGLALQRWAARKNLALSSLQFSYQGQAVNWGAKVQDHGFADGAVLDVAVVDCSSSSGVPGCGHPGGGLDKVSLQ